MKYFTGDPHFFHKFMMETRGYASLEEMHEDFIDRWNKEVHPGSATYILGDVAIKQGSVTADEIDMVLSRLNGTKLLVLGNHDLQNWKFFKDVYEKRFAKIEDIMYIKENGQKVFLSHYAHRTWRASIHGSWHLYAHSHGNMEPYGKSFDVGFDVFRRPISFDEVTEIMSTLEWHPEADQHLGTGEINKKLDNYT